MRKPYVSYKIETLCPVRGKWITLMNWWGMPKGKAEGAFMVLKAILGGNNSYRLCTDTGDVLETHNTGDGPKPARTT